MCLYIFSFTQISTESLLYHNHDVACYFGRIAIFLFYVQYIFDDLAGVLHFIGLTLLGDKMGTRTIKVLMQEFPKVYFCGLS